MAWASMERRNSTRRLRMRSELRRLTATAASVAARRLLHNKRVHGVSPLRHRRGEPVPA